MLQPLPTASITWQVARELSISQALASQYKLTVEDLRATQARALSVPGGVVGAARRLLYAESMLNPDVTRRNSMSWRGAAEERFSFRARLLLASSVTP